MILAKELENIIETMVEATKNCAFNPFSEENKVALKRTAEILKMTTQLGYGLEGTVNEIKEMLLQFVSGSNMDEITFVGLKYYQTYSNLDSKHNICILFKEHGDSTSGIYF